MSVEAAGIQGWQRWAHAPFGMARFGASAPFKAIYDKFGFTVENLTKQASPLLPFLPSFVAAVVMVVYALSLVPTLTCR